MGQRAFRKLDSVVFIFAIFLVTLASEAVASAQGVDFGNPAAPPPPTVFGPVPSPFGALWGIRDSAAKSGLTLSGIYTADILANVSGGLRTGAIVEDLIELDLDLDLEKIIGLKGGSLHVSGFEIHGTGLSQAYTGDLSGTSSIAAYDTARIAEYWYEQWLFDRRFSFKIGQFLADNEFYYSDFSNLFVCASFGAFTFLTNNYPFVPSYPMSAPGVRLLWQTTTTLAFRVGVYSGSTLSEAQNNSGLPNLRARDGLLSFWEADYKIDQEKEPTRLPATYKLGWIFHSRYEGAMNANPGSVNRSAYGFYLGIDQTIWQKPLTDKTAKTPSFGVFVRMGYMPPEFGFVARYIDGGFNYNGLFSGRNDDILGVGITHSGISREANRGNPPGTPRLTSETVIEVTYGAKLTSWLTVQPDIQYVINPGATSSKANATVIGIRSTSTF